MSARAEHAAPEVDVPPVMATDLRACVDLPGYAVDAEGNVYSQLRRVRRDGRCAGFTFEPDPSVRRLIRPEPDEYGYLRVRLVKDGRRVWRRVNILVCRAFHGEQPEGKPHVRHDDGNRTNNRADNLLWGSVQDNADDRVRHGTVLSGCDNPNARFDAPTVAEILADYNAGMAPKLIAAVRQVHVQTIQDLIAGRTYKRFRKQ